jgi:hypothetical protein
MIEMATLSIEVIDAQDLSDDMKGTYRVEYDDCSNFMIVKHGDETISVVNDYMEPEDATFTRDLRWITELLGEVYELGKSDGCD